METLDLPSELLERTEDALHYLRTKEAQETVSRKRKAAAEFRSRLESEGFQEGRDLSEESLLECFELLRRIANSMALNKGLINQNSVELVNAKMRHLLYGKEPVLDRIQSFLELKGAGYVMPSQFLNGLDPTEYPITSWPIAETLNVGDERREANRLAAKRFGLSSWEGYRWEAIRYLEDWEVYRALREKYDELDDYIQVNIALWYLHDRQDEEEEAPETVPGPVGHERDLQAHIAAHPELIEAGATLEGTEYDTEEVGRIDILLKGSDGAYIVVETKRGKGDRSAFGQLLGYMGWVKEKLGENVRGVLVAHGREKSLEHASRLVPNVSLKHYEVEYRVMDRPPED